MRLTLLSARVLVLEFGHIVYIFVDDDPEAVPFVVRGHIGSRESLRHDGFGDCGKKERKRR